MSNKKFLTVDEQIIYLKENKKIIVNDNDRHFFEDINYIALINPYKELFAEDRDINGNHVYLKETNFSEFLKIIEIDNRLSSVLFDKIRNFERKFKNLIIIELCNKYKEDCNCSIYLNEIRSFIDFYSKKSQDPNFEFYQLKDYLPRFCPNFLNVISNKGPKLDNLLIPSRIDLMNKIYSIGTGIDFSGEPCKKSNNLIKHYLETLGFVPLWTIQNGLTFGETSMLFSMLDLSSQNNIYSKFNNSSLVLSNGNFNFDKLCKFTGKIESIRNIRNTIGHYEPLFPVFVSNISSIKYFKSSQLVKSLELLGFDVDGFNPAYELTTDLKIDLNINNKNIRLVRLLEFMDFLSK